ncbi:MAG: Gfo/Idh/MocA family oxidoreductase [Chloroflexota bacterium]
MSNPKIRWGILSTAAIAQSSFIPATRQTDRGEIVAVASRNRDRAEAFAQLNEIPQVFDDYASMLASDEIDAVYNALPNTMHAEWTKFAAEQGKHVFCEKPLAMSPAEAQQMIDDCNAAGVLLLEAFVFLYHPQTLKLRELLDSGIIGELRQSHAHLTFHLERPTDNIRANKELGGGGLLDAGCYPITFTRFAFGQEPQSVQADVFIDPMCNVDTRAALLLGFSGSRFATIQTGMDAIGGPKAFLFGEKGVIEIPEPYHPKAQSHFTVRTNDGNEETFHFDTGKQVFAPAIEHFHDAILDGTPLRIGAENAIGSLNIIDAIFESAQSGQRIQVS